MKRKHVDQTEQMSYVVLPKLIRTDETEKRCVDKTKQRCVDETEQLCVDETVYAPVYQANQTRIKERFFEKTERRPIYVDEIKPIDHYEMRDLAYYLAVKKLKRKNKTFSGTTKSKVEFPMWKDVVLKNVWRFITAEIQEEATRSVAESDLELSSDSDDEDPDPSDNVDQDASSFGLESSPTGVDLSRIFDQSQELCRYHRQMLDDGNLVLEYDQSDSVLTYAPLGSLSTEDDMFLYENDPLMSDLYTNCVADPNMADAFGGELSLEDMFKLIDDSYFLMEPLTPLMEPLTPVMEPLTPVMEPLTSVMEPLTPVMEIDSDDSSSLNLSGELQNLESLNFDSDLENLVEM